jgi:hypothetical protein
VISRGGGTPGGALCGTEHTGRVLLQGIRNAGDEPLVLSTADPEAESANTYWLGASPHERLGASVEEVVAAFVELADRIRERVRESGHHGRVTFYVWHDHDSGQLRCSTASQPPESLPFRTPYQPGGDLADIVAGFLGDGEPGFVRFSGVMPAGAGEQTFAPPAVCTLDVTAQPTHDRQ